MKITIKIENETESTETTGDIVYVYEGSRHNTLHGSIYALTKLLLEEAVNRRRSPNDLAFQLWTEAQNIARDLPPINWCPF